MWSLFFFVWLSITISNIKCLNEKYEQDKDTYFGTIIKQILESLRPGLENLFIGYTEFKSGSQEFGELNGYVDQVHILGLEKFETTILDTSNLDIRNLTIVVNQFFMNCLYNLNGTLAFPLGKNDIHFFGNGEMRVVLGNVSFSIKMKIRSENGLNVVKVFDLQVNLEDMGKRKIVERQMGRTGETVTLKLRKT